MISEGLNSQKTAPIKYKTGSSNYPKSTRRPVFMRALGVFRGDEVSDPKDACCRQWLTTTTYLLWPGAHQPGVYCLYTGAWHMPHPDPAWTHHAKRLYRELQRQVPRRAPKRVLVRDPAPGPGGPGNLAPGLQRSSITQQSGAYATGPLLQAVPSARWRYSSNITIPPPIE